MQLFILFKVFFPQTFRRGGLGASLISELLDIIPFKGKYISRSRLAGTASWL